MLVTLLGMVTLVKLVQPLKRTTPNARNAVGDGHAGQTGAIIKRIIPNAYHRHAVYGSWDYNSSPPLHRYIR